MYCKKCGTLIAMGVTKCHACGADQASESKIIMPGGGSLPNANNNLNQNSTDNNKYDNKSNIEKTSNFKGIIFIVAILVIMALIVFLKVFNS